jgi:hypothetical protein
MLKEIENDEHYTIYHSPETEALTLAAQESQEQPGLPALLDFSVVLVYNKKTKELLYVLFSPDKHPVVVAETPTMMMLEIASYKTYWKNSMKHTMTQ